MNLFAYRVPFAREVIAGYSDETMIGFQKNSFIIAPFSWDAESVISIRLDKKLSLEEIDDYYNMLSSGDSLDSKKYPFPDKSTSAEQHSQSVRTIISSIQQGSIEKCVASRVIIRHGKIKISDTFRNLCESYPDAFVFFFHTPCSGSWMGASPELLIEKHCQKISSMSLAGTHPVYSQSGWTAKEIQEQKVVTDFIVDSFAHNHIKPVVGKTVTMKAGPVKHLMTKISGDSTFPGQVYSLLSQLAPTPALSGFPKHKAMNLISEIEHFNRGFYGGFCGWTDKNNDMTLYVNLRSMRLQQDKYCLFVGGGIMAESVPEDEWKETENKAKTLLTKIKEYEN